MPLYNYTCQNGHIVEKLLMMSERTNPGPCLECGGSLERIYLSREQDAARFRPIVLHESPDGEFSFPMHESAPVPPGFVKREIRTFAEADAVMKRVNAKERRKVEEKIESDREWLNHMESTNRSELRRAMQHMSPKGRALAELAMRINDAKPRPRVFDPGVFLDIRERDYSNRDEYRDERTHWKGRKV